MLIVSTDQVTPPSEVVKPDDVASFRARVSPKAESALSSTMVVERYSEPDSQSICIAETEKVEYLAYCAHSRIHRSLPPDTRKLFPNPRRIQTLMIS